MDLLELDAEIIRARNAYYLAEDYATCPTLSRWERAKWSKEKRNLGREWVGLSKKKEAAQKGVGDMLVVKIELWPGGDKKKKRSMGEMHIYNDGSGDAAIGNYNVEITKTGSRAVWRRGHIEGFPRKRLGPWDLMLRGLRAVVGARNE